MNQQQFSLDSNWIWGSDDLAQQNIWRDFRRRFFVPGDTQRATILITADSRYECGVNNHFIGRGPIRGYPFAYHYDVYDITPDLLPGQDNVITALVNHLGDHTMIALKGHVGFLCEITLEDSQGQTTRISSDTTWKTNPCRAFNHEAPRISAQLEFEEQYDARMEISSWQTLDFDDAGWEDALIIGPVGCAPWTSLNPNPISFLTENAVSPTEVMAIELARPRPGTIWCLDLRQELGTMRTGLRSAPPGERGSVLFTEVIAGQTCTVRIHSFPNYEPLLLRVNEQVFDGNGLGEIPSEVTFEAGSNLVIMKNVEWPSLLFESTTELTFTAERWVEGAAWVLISHLNEQIEEENQYWNARRIEDLAAGLQCIAVPASANKTDIFALTASQQFFSVKGGFCTHEITGVTPRPWIETALPLEIENPNALLHDHSQWTTINPHPDGDVHVLIDFGREIIGYLRLDLYSPEHAIIDANFFEGIDDGGIFWTRNLRNSFRLTCTEGRQTFTSHHRRGFRYVSLTFRNLTAPIKIRHVDVLMSTYPVAQKGRFACSDETLTKIWEVGAYTVQLCMLDTYVDCPAYEQVYWLGDARNIALVNAVAYGAYELTDRCIRLAGQSLSDEIAHIRPPHQQIMRTHITASHVASGWFVEIPMWTFLWMWMAWEHYQNTGDQTILADYYIDVRECLRRCTAFLTERDLLDIPDVWNLVDWAAQDLESSGEVIANSVLMAQSFDYAAKMADILGRVNDSVEHRGLAERIRSAVNRYGWSDQYQGYVDTVRDESAYERYRERHIQQGQDYETLEAFRARERISESTNTLVLRCGAVPPERHDAVMRFVLAARDGKFIGDIPDNAHKGSPDQVVPVGSPWFLFFTLETLFREGLADDALTILRDQWKRMLDKGATTFWETFPGNIGYGHWSRSLCHGWSAAPSYFLSSQVLGVQPVEPGFTRIRIAPQPFNLRWASGQVPTPRGVVTVNWQRDEDGNLTIDYNAPDGCEVEILLPRR